MSPFDRLAARAVARPKTVLAAAVLAAVLGLVAARGIELRTSNLDLIGEREPEVARFLALSEGLGSPSPLVVVFGGADREVLEAAVDRAAPVLRDLPGVRTVIERLPFAPEVTAALELEDYFATEDGDALFVFVQPRDSRMRATVIAPFVAEVEDTLAAMDLGSVTFGLTGIPKYALDDRDIIQRDLTRLSLLSLGLVTVLFLMAFRGVRGPLAATLALVVGVSVTLGLSRLVPGHLTLLSAFFVSMLMGLGIDYGIHLVARMEEAEREGACRPRAVLIATSSLRRGLVTSALTSAGVLYTLLFAGFKGFAELGLIAGTGILICLVTMYSVLPALLVLLPGRPGGAVVRRSRVGRLLERCQSPVLALSIPLVALVTVGRGPEFNGDYLDLQPEQSEALRLERVMVEESDYSPYFAVFLRPDRASAAELADRLREEVVVAEVRSITDLDLLFDDDERPVVPEEYARLFRNEEGDYAVYAYPAGDIWVGGDENPFLEAMRSIDGEVSGMPFLGALMVTRSERAMGICAVLSLVVLIVCVGLDFRDPVRTAIALVPPVLTMVWMMAVLRLTGQGFNPLNIMAIPIVLGIAVDDGVHLVHRYAAEAGRMDRVLAGSGRSVVLTTMTTLAAFGAVALTSHRGLRSFSLTLSVGVLAALALSVITLPALLRLEARFRGRQRAGETGPAGEPVGSCR